MQIRLQRLSLIRLLGRPWLLTLILLQALLWDLAQAAMAGSQSMSSGLHLEGWLAAATAM